MKYERVTDFGILISPSVILDHFPEPRRRVCKHQFALTLK